MKKFLFVTFALAGMGLQAQTTRTYTQEFDSVMRNVNYENAATGIIYDRVVPFANLTNYNSNEREPVNAMKKQKEYMFGLGMAFPLFGVSFDAKIADNYSLQTDCMFIGSSCFFVGSNNDLGWGWLGPFEPVEVKEISMNLIHKINCDKDFVFLLGGGSYGGLNKMKSTSFFGTKINYDWFKWRAGVDILVGIEWSSNKYPIMFQSYVKTEYGCVFDINGNLYRCFPSFSFYFTVKQTFNKTKAY